MALELSKDSLKAVRGRFYEDPAYHSEKDGLEAFDAQGPQKERHVAKTLMKIQRRS